MIAIWFALAMYYSINNTYGGACLTLHILYGVKSNKFKVNAQSIIWKSLFVEYFFSPQTIAKDLSDILILFESLSLSQLTFFCPRLKLLVICKPILHSLLINFSQRIAMRVVRASRARHDCNIHFVWFCDVSFKKIFPHKSKQIDEEERV